MAYATISALRECLPQVPEWGQQLITLSGATGGTFTLGYEGGTTPGLAATATATQVQTALRALGTIGASGVNVKGRPGGPWTAAFQGQLATDAAPLTTSAAGLTPMGATVSVVPATDGLLQRCLDRATDIVRQALRAAIGDPGFDYVAYGVASTKTIQSYGGAYLALPPHQAGSVTSVVWGSSVLGASTYTETPSGALRVSTPTSLFVWDAGLGGGGWGMTTHSVTAVWGYGPTPPDSIVELVIELAVNIWRTKSSGGYVDVVGVEGAGGIRVITGLNKQQVMVIESVRDQLMQVCV